MRKEESLLSLQGVCFQRDGRRIIQDVSFMLMPRKIMTIIGPNGAGKTTLLKLLLGLLKPTVGTITKRSGLKVGYMPQKIHINPSLPITVARFLELAERHITDAQVEEALTRVGASHLKKSSVHVLSGGEIQRVLLAHALLGKPDLLVLDEPVQGVDVLGQAELYTIIAGVREILGCSVLLVSHDLHLVMAASDEVLCLNGHICCSGSPDHVSQDPAYIKLFGSAKGKEELVKDSVTSYTHHHDHKHDD